METEKKVVVNSEKELANMIHNWERHVGESFTDRFMHDCIVWPSWLFWLVGKGYSDFAVPAIEKISSGETYLDQEELFDIFNTMEDWSDENYDKQVDLWAEFLFATPTYQKRVVKFFERN